MAKKVKTIENKAKNMETKQKIERLWAQYGKLQAQREHQGVALEQTVQQMRQISVQIAQLEQNKEQPNAKKQ